MPDQITLEIVTPEKLILEAQVEEVKVPGQEGDFGVLPGHCEFLTTLREGELQYRAEGQLHTLILKGGFAEVRDNRVIILADGDISPSDS